MFAADVAGDVQGLRGRGAPAFLACRIACRWPGDASRRHDEQQAEQLAAACARLRHTEEHILAFKNTVENSSPAQGGASQALEQRVAEVKERMRRASHGGQPLWESGSAVASDP